MINPAMEERKARMEKIQTMIGGLIPIPYKKLLSIIQINTGASDITARSYLNTVIEFNEFVVESGIVKKKT